MKTKFMNYKDKKYIFERKQLLKNIENLDLFLIAQLKSCNSQEWIELQKDLKKLGLKSKLISFRNCKNTDFFSELAFQSRVSLFKGSILLLHGDEQNKFFIGDVAKLSKNVRPLLLYSDGRVLDVGSKTKLLSFTCDFKEEWFKTVEILDEISLPKTLELIEDTTFSVLRMQSFLLMNILEYKISNESEF